MNTVIVGIDPGTAGRGPLDPDFPSGRRLSEAAGLAADEFRLRFDRVNLYPFPGERTREEQQGARENLLPILRGRRVIILGQHVQKSLGVWGEKMAWIRGDGFVYASVPHPSGLSRWWNDPDNLDMFRRFMKRSLRPCIHVEGVDGSGKTTLAEQLAKDLDLHLVPTDDPPRSWDECLKRIQRRVGTGVVCDRSSGLISELVYGPVLRGGTITDEADLWAAVRSVLHAVTFVYCRPPLAYVQPTFRPEEDPVHVEGVKKRGYDLLVRYDRVMEEVSRIGGRVIRHDWTNPTLGGIKRCVE